jgi:hypothetical protein
LVCYADLNGDFDFVYAGGDYGLRRKIEFRLQTGKIRIKNSENGIWKNEDRGVLAGVGRRVTTLYVVSTLYIACREKPVKA